MKPNPPSPKFTEARLEQSFVELLQQQGYPHVLGTTLRRAPEEVLIEDDLVHFLQKQYRDSGITASEIQSIVRSLKVLPASDLYESNKSFLHKLSDGFILKREDSTQKDLYIQLIDYSGLETQLVPDEKDLSKVAEKVLPYAQDHNIYKFVTQLEIQGSEKRIPDGILYVNGLPLVVFEFKSTVREEPNIHEAYVQLTTRYQRDIPELFKYNAFCVISDGINSKSGTLFSPYEFFYAWRRVAGMAKDVQGIQSMFTLIEGMLQPKRLRDILRNFIFIPDSSTKNEKILCRYPQYYAARALYDNIKKALKPGGNGKGGTYFGATGCGKSYTMQYLTRLLMRSAEFNSPTIVLITDRTDLDDQLGKQFQKAKKYIGDDTIISVESRKDLRERLQGRNSGGVFLTTIHKFNEDIQLLTDRSNVICISDEAHRSQTNLDQKVRFTEEKGVTKTYGFAKYLHDSLPNATFVGFTGTPIDATLDVFGPVIDSYTMTESVADEITVRLVYEGRAAKVLLNSEKIHEIEEYYNRCAEEGSNEHQIEQSKKDMAQMNAIIGDPSRLRDLAKDFVEHYEKRVSEGSTIKGKAMFVCSSREIAWEFYQNVLQLRPAWGEIRTCEEGSELSEKEQKEILPIERIKMVMTRGKDDEKQLYELLGTSADRKELDKQFKNEKSNFKIAVVVDMWLTGFDVPFLDTIYIDKPIQRHNLIQTISRVNRKFAGKDKGLVVDYIGIKKQMNLAMAIYNNPDNDNIEDIQQSVTVVKDQLDLLNKIFHKFDVSKYYSGTPLEQLHTLNRASEFVQLTKDIETRYMNITKRLKTAYDICVGSELISQQERDTIHFYLAVRSILFKLNKGEAPDTAQMNNRVKAMIEEAIKSQGVEEIFKLGEDEAAQIDIFDEDYLNKIDKIKLPNTKIKLLQKLLAKAIDEVRKVNKVQGIDFAKRFQAIVEKYNERDENDVLRGEVLDDFANEIIELYYTLRKEKDSFQELGIDFEEKAFYDILKAIAHKYDFYYAEEKLILLAQKVKEIVDDKAKYTDWSKRDDIKAELKADLIVLLTESGYPPAANDEAYQEIFEQAENFKKYRK